MTEVRFYHLTRSRLEDALPQLLEKCLERKWRVLVMASSEERVEALAERLWTYRDRSFLPHGTHKDGYPEAQPVWLATEDANPNGASVLFLTDNATSRRVSDYDLVAELFDGGDEGSVVAARRRWVAYREAGHDLTYWKQSESGRWEKAA